MLKLLKFRRSFWKTYQSLIKEMAELPVLRDYQVESLRLLEALECAGVKRALLYLPTGGGKTTVAGRLIYDTLNSGKRTLFVAHRRELIRQCVSRLDEFGVKAGVVLGGKKQVVSKALVGSVFTLVRRELPTADVVVIDEAHHAASGSFAKLLNYYSEQGSFIVGLTATPYRLDNKPLTAHFDQLVAPTSVGELTERGWLVPVRFYGKVVDLGRVKLNNKGDDYDKHELKQRWDKQEFYSGVVTHWLCYAKGLKTICFNIDVEHSKKTAEAFNAVGIKAIHVDAETPLAERDAIVEAFAAGEFMVMCNVSLFGEGYDLPDVQGVILNFASLSRAWVLQCIGRCMRPAVGKDFGVVIDQANNYATHKLYLPWDEGVDEIFSELEKNKKRRGKKKQAPPIKECSCGMLLPLSATVCGGCGRVFRLNRKADVDMVTHADFEELTPAVMKVRDPMKNHELPEHLQPKHWNKLTISELEQVRVAKKYKVGWLVQMVARRCNYDRDELEVELTIYALQQGHKEGFVEYWLGVVLNNGHVSSLRKAKGVVLNNSFL